MLSHFCLELRCTTPTCQTYLALGIGLMAGLVAHPTVLAQTSGDVPWPVVGEYQFDNWGGPSLRVCYCVPARANSQSPLLIVVPGAKRNAVEYRDQWHDLAVANRFITLVVGASLESFPSEYEYNLGGVINAAGELQPKEKWLFASIDPLFEDFTKRFGSTRKTYDLYGHSAGGGFVHRFLLFLPDAKVRRAVAANPAFVTLPDDQKQYPFGIQGAPLEEQSLRRWFDRRLVILLGERDLGPRTKPLSNGPDARLQGPNVFARGLNLYRSSLILAKRQNLPFRWQLEVVPNVGHSNTHMASHAAKHLCQQ